MNQIIITNEKGATLKTLNDRSKKQTKAFLEAIQGLEIYGYIVTDSGKVSFKDYLRFENSFGTCAERLSKAMSERGLDNQALAELALLDQSCIWRLLKGQRKASYDTVKKLEAVLGDIF